jgi:glycerate 2-kinase
VPAAVSQLRRDALDILDAALRAVSPHAVLARIDVERALPRPLASFRSVSVVGAGKAAMAMAGALEPRLAGSFDGLVVVPHGYPASLPVGERAPSRIRIATAAHPVPDAAGARAASRALRLAEHLGNDDLLIVLLSGGGSALWTAPVPGVSLEDVRATTRALVASGADIHAINAVRKHLSLIAGGRLAAAAAPATVLALAISDVIGDDPSTIASGPTVGDATTFADARDVLRGLELWDDVPTAVRQVVTRGAAGEISETPAPGDARLATATTLVIGSNADALDAAAGAARQRGYLVRRAPHPLAGEARRAGARLAAELDEARARRVCLLAGGETTVRVSGKGTGGRNQEAALAAALQLERARTPAALLCAGTDGIDGPTDAAGAIVDGTVASRARDGGMDPLAHLEDNDAYPVLDAAGALIRTGPTHTNVMDLAIGLVAGTGGRTGA